LNNASAKRTSLLQRVRGPNAKPVDLLVQLGTASAARVNTEYGAFARARVEEIAALMAGLGQESMLADWQALQLAIQDLRSSSATCGNEAVSLIARSWERALDWQYRREAKLMAVLRLHLDALRLATSQIAEAGELQALSARLEAVVKSLNPTVET
jgi:hypothetical protein